MHVHIGKGETKITLTKAERTSLEKACQIMDALALYDKTLNAKDGSDHLVQILGWTDAEGVFNPNVKDAK